MLKTNLVNLQKKNPDFELLYKGAYEYISSGVVYSEENFHVYRNIKDSGLLYQTELLTRLESGEFMRAETHYQVNKDYIPVKISIDKFIGNGHIQEIYSTDYSRTNLTYRYIMNETEERANIQVPPKYLVATSHTACSFTFLGQKKYDPTGRNFHNVIISDNQWEYHGPPEMSYVLLVRDDGVQNEITLEKTKVKGTNYNLYSSEEYEKENEKPLQFSISKHLFIPYLVQIDENTRVQIKFLTEVEKTKLDEIY